MAREDEIMYKAGSIVDGMVSNNVPSEICDSYYQGFIEGAKFAEQKTIEKARKWVKNAFFGPFGKDLANSVTDEFVKTMKLE